MRLRRCADILMLLLIRDMPKASWHPRTCCEARDHRPQELLHLYRQRPSRRHRGTSRHIDKTNSVVVALKSVIRWSVVEIDFATMPLKDSVIRNQGSKAIQPYNDFTSPRILQLSCSAEPHSVLIRQYCISLFDHIPILRMNCEWPMKQQ